MTEASAWALNWIRNVLPGENNGALEHCIHSHVDLGMKRPIGCKGMDI
jgi:hypothetical protein